MKLSSSKGNKFTEEQFEQLKEFKKIEVSLVTSGYVVQPTIATTLLQDPARSQEDAIREVHSKLWPGDSASVREVRERLENMFFSPKLYDLTRVGRIRMNRKLHLSIPDTTTALTLEDLVATLKYLVSLRERAEGTLDDVDHLGNRRVRLVGELLTNQVYVGFTRIDRIVREKFRMLETNAALMPQDFLNVKPLGAVLREFFGTGQLSQFMDQTNPLAEIAHKRRLSALGPGGVMKDRATYEIRDVHTSHYGRICPIETPEGQTIGLISSLATYAMVNDLGFIETPYRPVVDGKIKDEVVFLDAFQEANKYITQSSAAESDQHKLKSGKVFVRHEGNFQFANPDEVNYIDLSPKQLVSVATALIPFLEHDDASRALMGSNMQRQAVPLINCKPPLVGTGMEPEIVKATGAIITAKRSGMVEYVSAEKIIVRAKAEDFATIDDWIAQGIDTYYLRKFERSSYSTWIHQAPIVKPGDIVQAGDVLTNGPAIIDGELALGFNLNVAFMPWYGYNFEDAIVVSRRLVADDSLTSVHIDEEVVEARETKLGPEEITRDIPNVSESALECLDEDGIVRIGTRVKAGDILVGKVTLKGDIQYSPEEKLLRAIFGEKSREVRDTSLRVQPGVEGTVIDVKVFSRSGIRKDKRYRDIVAKQTLRIETDHVAHTKFLHNMIKEQVIELLHGQEVAGKAPKEFVKKGVFDKELLQQGDLDALSANSLFALKTANKSVNEKITAIRDSLENQLRILAGLKEERINNLKKGDNLPSGVIKMVKVYVAKKRTISMGDKLAGRHGNKGVVSILVPREDMPFMDDGTPVDIVLNPLGVPSRMNVGQILETLMGFAGRDIGIKLQEMIDSKGYDEVKKFVTKYYGADLIKQLEESQGRDAVWTLAHKTAKAGAHFASPIFDGANYDTDIKPLLKDLGLSEYRYVQNS